MTIFSSVLLKSIFIDKIKTIIRKINYLILDAYCSKLELYFLVYLQLKKNLAYLLNVVDEKYTRIE